ncbi:VirD4-like conjugal transfer protein, CD1115 family [Desulfovirgula thermocuniculi]|uniref:VirD4-like conjugal transfer protein, CD1115 family n=1 Tax=Desulfovirgula thermocuniculi TaxID=348842 RepID=UPI00042A8E2D|nr:type IV secretory system conjugative DNA transfer family protein [Desulfovirgula thermocuniculi]
MRDLLSRIPSRLRPFLPLLALALGAALVLLAALYPGLVALILAALFAALLARRVQDPGRRAGLALLPPALALGLAWGAAGVTQGFAVGAANLAKKPAPPPPSWQVWVSSKPAPGPADKAGRACLYAGAVLGLLLVAALRSKEAHDERHVHGLPVADSAAKGTSRWAGDRDIAHVAEFGPPKEGPHGGGTVVGKLKGRIVRLVPDKCVPPLPQHALVVAGTGGGKSFSFVIPNAVAAACEGESLVLTDPKGELACTLGPWLKAKGYQVYLFNLAYPEWSSCWNPVLECRDDEEITAFATAIVQNAAKDKAGYFVMKEIQLLKALVYLLRADFPPEQAHLRAALSLLSWPVEALDERFERAYREGRLPQEGYEEWRGAVSSNYDNAVSGLSAKLNVVRSEPVARLLSRHEIDLSAIGKEKAALFCVLPIGSAHLKPVLATFYYFFFRRLYGLAAENGGRLPNPARFLLDEFANIGQVPGFTEVISTARSLGIKIQFVLQGLKQLQDVYGAAEAEAIISNCPIQLFLGGDDLATTRYFSSRLGEAAVYAESERKDVTMPWQKATEIPKRTENVVRRPLMQPEELSRMKPLDAVCLVRWCLPLHLKKLGWEELPQAREIQSLAAKILAELCPARPEFRVELPPVPEVQGPPEGLPERRRGRKPAPPPAEPELEVEPEDDDDLSPERVKAAKDLGLL